MKDKDTILLEDAYSKLKYNITPENKIKYVGVPKLFIVVTYPTDVSVLRDIYQLITFEDFGLQYKGGLHVNDIYGIYAPEYEKQALKDARDLLSNKKNKL